MRRNKVAAVLVSLAVHALLMAVIAVDGALKLYRSVDGFQIGDFGGGSTVTLINPADYGYGRRPGLTSVPEVKPLDELVENEATDTRESGRKEDEAEDDVEEGEEHSIDQAEAENQDESIDDAEEGPDAARQFGRLDTAPLRKHIASFWMLIEEGKLAVPQSFSITAVCRVNPDGTLSDISLTESSGSPELDRTALTVLEEIAVQRAFAPLSRLSSVSVKLEINPTFASFSLAGFAPSPTAASDISAQYRTLLAAARLLVADSRTRDMLNATSIRNESNLVSARITLPAALAGEMMHAGFSGRD